MATANYDGRLTILDRLNQTVNEAAALFSAADESLCDGHQTARQVLSHLVFWHREYVQILRALLRGREPLLQSGSFAALNAQAACEFSDQSLPALAGRLTELQAQLDGLARQLPDWTADFPVKRGGRHWSIEARLCTIESHIRNHLVALQRAARHGAAWVRAYYPTAVQATRMGGVH
ncbi:MAG: DinB family protein [Chloroflexota bacterium]